LQDKAEFLPHPFFDPVFDTFQFSGLLGSFSGNKAVMLGTFNQVESKFFAVRFPENTSEVLNSKVFTEDIGKGHLAVLPSNNTNDPHVFGITNSGGPSTLLGGLYNGSFHYPTFYAFSDTATTVGVTYPTAEESEQLFWRNKNENYTGLLNGNLIQTSWGQFLHFSMSGHGVSTGRNPFVLWVQNSSNNSVLGYLTFGQSAPEVILDFKVFNYSGKVHVAALTSSGLYIKTLSAGLAGIDSWDGNSFSPSNVTSGSTWIQLDGITTDGGADGIADSLDLTIAGGRLAADDDNRRDLVGPANRKLLVWLSSENSKHHFYAFEINSAGALTQKSHIFDPTNFRVSAKNLSGSEWPRGNHFYYSKKSETAHISVRDSSLLTSIDLSDIESPILRLNALPSATIPSMSCHEKSDRCFIFDTSNLELWRLK